MSVKTADYLEAVAHLPQGAMLVIPQASWEEYERLLDDLTGRPGVRVTYDRGRLEIMSPSPEHEEYKELILRIVHVASEVLGVPLETRGSTTWKRRSDQHGLEPDTCFYIANAHRVVGRRTLDLESDPAPDIAVEIDLTTESVSKLPIYAALGVPEIWLYDGKTTRFYALADDGYREVAESQFLRGLTSVILTDVLTASKTSGQTAALVTFRRRFHNND